MTRCAECGGPTVEVWARYGLLGAGKVELCARDLKRAAGKRGA